VDRRDLSSARIGSHLCGTSWAVLHTLPSTPELTERLVRHDQVITQALEGFDQVLRSPGPEPVEVEQDARLDGDHCLTESGVEFSRRSDLVADGPLGWLGAKLAICRGC
jgi:hypothetical protein